MNILCVFLLFISFNNDVRADIYSSIYDMEFLLETREVVLSTMETYIANHEMKIAELKAQIQRQREENQKAKNDVHNYLGNPINSFKLIKSLTAELDNLQICINGSEIMKNVNETHPELKIPLEEDLIGSSLAISRLRNTYKMSIRDLSDGIINGNQYSSSMSADDCYEIGVTLYEQYHYQFTYEWMLEALRKYDDNQIYCNLKKHLIYEYIAYCQYLMGDLPSAIKWSYILLSEFPKNQNAKNNIDFYEKEIIRLKENGETARNQSRPVTNLEVSRLDRYEALCRGDLGVPHDIARSLNCRYETKNHPFLQLAPIKVEQVYSKPDIYLFHNVISDDEIEFVKNMSYNRFIRAQVYNADLGEGEVATYRVSKAAWIHDDEHITMAKLSQRIADMTGLEVNTDNAELLQVSNYGLGGHYEPHYDVGLRHEPPDRISTRSGNRIATVMFYMSDVTEGGATAFNEIGLSVFPVKNAAVYWHNLHPSGEADLATLHAACPVLRGAKWVSNKWIHLAGQEFLKPCNLEYQDEGFAHPIIAPLIKNM